MKVPERVRIGPFDYVIHHSEAEINRCRAEMESKVDGAHWTGSSEIFIDPAISIGQKRDTLLHEIQHALYKMVGHYGDHSQSKISIEAAVRELTPLLLDTLQRNPDLRAFLFDDDSD